MCTVSSVVLLLTLTGHLFNSCVELLLVKSWKLSWKSRIPESKLRYLIHQFNANRLRHAGGPVLPSNRYIYVHSKFHHFLNHWTEFFLWFWNSVGRAIVTGLPVISVVFKVASSWMQLSINLSKILKVTQWLPIGFRPTWYKPTLTGKYCPSLHFFSLDFKGPFHLKVD